MRLNNNPNYSKRDGFQGRGGGGAGGYPDGGAAGDFSSDTIQVRVTEIRQTVTEEDMRRVFDSVSATPRDLRVTPGHHGDEVLVMVSFDDRFTAQRVMNSLNMRNIYDNGNKMKMSYVPSASTSILPTPPAGLNGVQGGMYMAYPHPHQHHHHPHHPHHHQQQPSPNMFPPAEMMATAIPLHQHHHHHRQQQGGIGAPGPMPFPGGFPFPGGPGAPYAIMNPAFAYPVPGPFPDGGMPPRGGFRGRGGRGGRGQRGGWGAMQQRGGFAGFTPGPSDNSQASQTLYLSATTLPLTEPLHSLFLVLEAYGGVVTIRRNHNKKEIVTVKAASPADADAISTFVRQIPFVGGFISAKKFPSYVEHQPCTDDGDCMDAETFQYDFTASRHRSPGQRSACSPTNLVKITGCGSLAEADLMTYFADKNFFPDRVCKMEDEYFLVQVADVETAVRLLIACQGNVCGEEKSNVIFVANSLLNDV